MESQSAAIQARELTKRFGAFTAVDDVSFEVRRGELFGLLGPNGAGKTTLSRMLTTLIVPTSGQGFVAGFDVARDPVRVGEAIGVIPQALTSDLDLTGWENVDIYGGFYNLRGRVGRGRGQHLIHLVCLTQRATARVRTSSGGVPRRRGSEALRDGAGKAGRARSQGRSRRPDCRSGRRRRPRDAEDYQRNRERRRQGFLDQARADVARGRLHPLHRTAPARRTGAQGRLLQLELRDADAAGTLREEAGP